VVTEPVEVLSNHQILYLVDIHKGVKAKDLASLLGITPNKIFKTVEKYNSMGVGWKTGKSWGGRREERCLMSLDEERIFLSSIEDEAFAGQILTYKQIKSKFEIRLGNQVSDDYVWDMFKRHGWSKKAPRKRHPQADRQAQDEYKKNFPSYWLPKH
jgi:transposase